MSWHDQAACRNHDPEIFFPIGETGPALQQLADAKAVCATCPVRRPCLLAAFASGSDHGVWGGWSENERRTSRRPVRSRQPAWAVGGTRNITR